MHAAKPAYHEPLSDASPFARIQDVSQLGHMLREVRVAHGIEIAEVATELHLKPAFIEAIESGNWDKLPGEAYGRGYTRQYAEFLKLSPHEAAACCLRIQGKVNPKLRYLNISSTQEKPSRGVLWVSALLLLAVLFGWQEYQEQTRSISTSSETITPPNLADDANRISTRQVTHNVRATCLNIPSRIIRPCYPVPKPAPSLLLTAASPYPIWKTSWPVTQ